MTVSQYVMPCNLVHNYQQFEEDYSGGEVFPFLKNQKEVYIFVCIRIIQFFLLNIDRLCGLVVRVPGYTTEIYCASCEVRTEFIYDT
jgi:hypothetical protein